MKSTSFTRSRNWPVRARGFMMTVGKTQTEFLEFSVFVIGSLNLRPQRAGAKTALGSRAEFTTLAYMYFYKGYFSSVPTSSSVKIIFQTVLPDVVSENLKYFYRSIIHKVNSR